MCSSITIQSMLLVVMFFAVQEPLCAANKAADYNLTVDFGIVTLGESIRRTFVIENKTQQEARFSAAESSCDCVRILVYPALLRPHDKAKIQLQLVPPVIGEYAFEIFLKQDDPARPDFRYLILCTIADKSGNTEQDPIAPLDARPLKSKDPALLKSVEWVMKHRGSVDVVLVDVQADESIGYQSIDGAVKVPLSSIRRKASLLNKQVILVNNGLEYSMLEEECVRLREKGFSAWILDGGTRYWHNARQAENTASVVQLVARVERIAPKDFFAEKNYDNWILINTSDEMSVPAKMLFPRTHHLPMGQDADSFARGVQPLLQDAPQTPLSYVLFYTDEGDGYDAVVHQVQGVNGALFFFLDGGVQGYQTFWEQMTGNLLSLDGLVREPCPDCPKKNLEKKYLSNE